MKRILSLIIITLATAAIVYPQKLEYRTALGFRAGLSQGITVKHFLDRNNAIEGLFTTKWQGVEFSGLYEMHNFGAFDVDHLYWYYGFGGHLGFFNGENVSWGEDGQQYVAIGVDGIIGMEYTFTEAPISLGLDLKPGFNFVGYIGFWYDAALSIRYTF
jgi:hypothetical protein